LSTEPGSVPPDSPADRQTPSSHLSFQIATIAVRNFCSNCLTIFVNSAVELPVIPDSVDRQKIPPDWQPHEIKALFRWVVWWGAHEIALAWPLQMPDHDDIRADARIKVAKQVPLPDTERMNPT
jgi:hypothetical protein